MRKILIWGSVLISSLVFLSGSKAFAQNRRISRIETVYPIPIKKGTVTLSAFVTACSRKSPFQGTFLICRNDLNKIQDSTEKYPQPYCSYLATDSQGYGKISLQAGNYQVRPPLSCPPGKLCLLRPLVVDPFSWKIDPSSFRLIAGGVVEVKAIGYNNLLMCPIRLEE